MPGGPPTGPGKPPLPVLGRCCPLTALCPQYEQTLPVLVEPDPRQELRAQIRKNITETLVSLRVNTVDDIQQVAAALAQCTVGQTSPAAAWPPHALRAPFPAKPARLCAPQGGPRGSGHAEHQVGAADAETLSSPGLWSPPCCPGVSSQAGLGSVLMQAACQEASGGQCRVSALGLAV